MRTPEVGLVSVETAKAINDIEGKHVRCTICGSPMPHLSERLSEGDRKAAAQAHTNYEQEWNQNNRWSV